MSIYYDRPKHHAGCVAATISILNDQAGRFRLKSTPRLASPAFGRSRDDVHE